MVGEIPLKVIGPPVMMVMVPMAKRVVSPLEVATMVRVAVVGTVVGALYKPFWSMEPQAGLQVGNWGKLMPLARLIVPCVISQVTPLGVPMSLVKEAVN